MRLHKVEKHLQKTKQTRFFMLKENQEIFKKWKTENSALDMQYEIKFLINQIQNTYDVNKYINVDYLTKRWTNRVENYSMLNTNKTTYDMIKKLTPVERLYLAQLLTIRILKVYNGK